MTNATAILCADIHIRADVPKARTDDFHGSMWNKLGEILQLAHNNGDCPILVAGDLGEKAEWPDWLEARFIVERMKYPNVEILVVPGQHDLPQHNIELLDRSALGVLDSAGMIDVLIDEWSSFDRGKIQICVQPLPYGQEMVNWPIENKPSNVFNIAMIHQLIIEGNTADWKGQSASPALDLLKKFSEYDLILSGDNHKPFVVEYEGRLLVNPGSMMRSTADQISHRPRVYLWWAETNECSVHYLPIKRGVLSREHLEQAEDKTARMEAFVRSVKNREELKLSFEKNMEIHLADNPALKPVEQKIWASME